MSHHSSQCEYTATPAQDTEPTDLPKHSVKPTWKVMENYEALRTELFNSLKLIWDKIAFESNTVSVELELLTLQGAIKQLSISYELYQLTSDKFINVLQNMNTELSLEELKNFKALNLERDSFIQQTKSKAEAKIELLQDTASHRSVSTRHSKRSSRSHSSRYSTLSERLINARAEVEASKVQVAYAEKTARQRATIEILNEQCKHDAAMAKLRVLEQAISADEGASEKDSINLNIADMEDPLKRTKDYVLSHCSIHSIVSNAPGNLETPSQLQVKEVPATSCMQNHSNAFPACLPNLPSYATEHQSKLQASHQFPVIGTALSQRTIGTTDFK